MLRPTLAAAALIAGLAACNAGGADAPAAPDPAATEPPGDDPDAAACGADKLARWLNALPTDDVKAQIAATVGERAIRYYAQGDPITMDYSESRLNVELGEDGRIKRFRCG